MLEDYWIVLNSSLYVVSWSVLLSKNPFIIWFPGHLTSRVWSVYLDAKDYKVLGNQFKRSYLKYLFLKLEMRMVRIITIVNKARFLRIEKGFSS